MKFYIGTSILFLFIFTGFSYSQAVKQQTDEAAIRKIIMELADAWAAGDGARYATAFADDADFIVWNGLHIKGREAIAGGHQHIFDTFYKGTWIEFEITSIRFLSPDAAIVMTEGNLLKKGEAAPPIHNAFPTYVLKKDKNVWRIVMFQNTLNDVGGK